jgi:selenophosphate synthetase-related protein
LANIVETVRNLPGVTGKSAIRAVSEILGGSDWINGPGDDGAVIASGSGDTIVCGEAITTAFVTADPRGAGVSAILANVNDIAAMGARPIAIVDTVVGSNEAIRSMLDGLNWAAQLYDVPIVGGHLTQTDGPPSLSAFAIGRANSVLSVRNAAAGQSLILGCCLEGSMRPDFPFFSALLQRGEKLAGDVRLLAEIADHGLAVAAKDVSMAGLVGSLAMMLEANRLGATVDLDAVPVPVGVALSDWLGCFPSYAFLLATPPGTEAECLAAFHDRGLAAARIGSLNDSGKINLRLGGEVRTAFDLTVESVTNLQV